jgi:hypothetical protein
MYKFGLAQQGTPIRGATIVSPPVPIVTVSGVTYTGATVSWTGSAGTYTIVGSTGSTYSGGLTLGSKLTKTVAVVKLPQGGTYTARVFASAGGTYITSSQSVPIIIPYKPPTSPVIKTTTIGYNGVTLAWSASVSNTKQITYVAGTTQGSIITSNLTGFVPLTAGATYSLSVVPVISGITYTTLSVPKTIYIPLPARPSVPVVTQTGATYSGVKLSWSPQSVVQPLAKSVTYDIIETTSGLTYASGLADTSATVKILAGNNNIVVVARAGTTFSTSTPIAVIIPYQKPAAPVLSQPVLGSTGVQVSWSAATGNSSITYDIISLPAGVTYASGITGTTRIIPSSAFPSYSQYPLQVIARAGSTFSTSAGATLRFTPPPPDDILVNYLSTRGCQLTWAPPPINTGVSYSISELSGSTFSVVQGPAFDEQTGLWIAGVTFGSAQVYDFFISGVNAGITGTTSEIVVYVPTVTEPVVKFYGTPGTYSVKIPLGFSRLQAQLVGGGGGGGSSPRDYVLGGGGGAGGMVITPVILITTTVELLVGRGGFANGGNGNDSSIINFVARGGDGGGAGNTNQSYSIGSPGLGGGFTGFIGKTGNNGEAITPGIGYNIADRMYGYGGEGGGNDAAGSAPSSGNPGLGGYALITFFA